MKYEFFVDCFNKTGYAKIQKTMTDAGFVCYDLQGTLLGKLRGVKEFKSRKEADKEARKLYLRNKKLINQVTVLRW